jgi:hypothetical protein
LGNPETLVQTTTGEAGSYQLTYTFTSVCEPEDDSGDWIEASADGYETASTFASTTSGFSDPVIYCTNDPQVIDLTLQPFGSLQVITNTSGSGLDPEGYALLISGLLPHNSVEYWLGLNDELLLPQVLPRQYSLELTEVAGNCTVAGGNPRTVAVAARQMATSTFQVTCAL